MTADKRIEADRRKQRFACFLLPVMANVRQHQASSLAEV